MSRTFREIAETVITAAIIFVLLQTATQTFKVVGPSMNTTLADGQHLLVNKFVYETVESDVLADILPWVDPDVDGDVEYLFHPPQRGDIIVFRPPTGEEADFVKRVIGIPGDEINIRQGAVWINGVKLDEDRITRPRGSTDFPTTVPPDSYFVLGDNRSASNDSRAWGFASADQIVGKVMARYWPPSEFKLF